MNDYSTNYSSAAEFKKWANEAGKHGLVSCSSGNMSHRLENGTILISESRKWLPKLTINDIAILVPASEMSNDYDIKDKILKTEKQTYKFQNDRTPSGELPLHLSVLENNKYNTVLHCQSPAATIIACRNEPVINYNVIIEVPIYIGKVKHLPFIMPGSQALASAVKEHINDHTVIQLQNHGQIIAGASYAETIQRAVFFELACRIILSNGSNTSYLSNADISKLAGYR